MIYEITDPLISTKPADELDVELLEPGDKIANYVFCRLVPVDSEVDASAGDHKQELFPFDFTEVDGVVHINLDTNRNKQAIPDDAVLMCFVASIQVDKKFKVYMNFGERMDINSTLWAYKHGYKLRDEKLARKLFSVLAEYEFVVT